ncbi:BON domain-containing protein [Roseateles sp.]|uniref:BON domain-containing protein n=1 Tax=Roseateles sp. TaxID=1971397 RepID=UPI003265A08D
MNNTIRPIALVASLAVACTVLLAACSKPAETGTEQAPATSAANNVVDGEVTTHVKTALISEPSLAGMDITVTTTKGDVRLTGVLQTQAQVDTALRIARAAEGAHTIHDELRVKQ